MWSKGHTISFPTIELVAYLFEFEQVPLDGCHELVEVDLRLLFDRQVVKKYLAQIGLAASRTSIQIESLDQGQLRKEVARLVCHHGLFLGHPWVGF